MLLKNLSKEIRDQLVFNFRTKLIFLGIESTIEQVGEFLQDKKVYLVQLHKADSKKSFCFHHTVQGDADMIAAFVNWKGLESTMKIFKVESCGGADWVIGTNEESVKDFYKNQIGLADFEDFEFEEIPRSEWNKNYILNPDYPEPEDRDPKDNNRYAYGYKIESTFEEYSQKLKTGEHDIIATSDF